jgi:hypothetical protein
MLDPLRRCARLFPQTYRLLNAVAWSFEGLWLVLFVALLIHRLKRDLVTRGGHGRSDSYP